MPIVDDDAKNRAEGLLYSEFRKYVPSVSPLPVGLDSTPVESLQEITNVALLPVSLVSTPAELLHYLSAKEAFLDPLPFIWFHFLLRVNLHLFLGIHCTRAAEGS